MSNYSKLYWLTRLDGFSAFMTTIMVLSVIALAIYGITCLMYYIEEEEALPTKYNKWRNWPIGLFFFAGIVSTFTPTKNEAILIMAGGKTLDYVQKDTSLAKVPFQTTAIISEYLDKTLKEMKEDKK